MNQHLLVKISQLLGRLKTAHTGRCVNLEQLPKTARNGCLGLRLTGKYKDGYMIIFADFNSIFDINLQ